MHIQKGQSILEFAVVLPLFLLVIYGIIYFGMAFTDYMALNNIARSSVREASLTSGSDYSAIYKKYSQDDVPIAIYTWDSSDNTNGFKIEDIDDDVKVTIHAELASDSFISSLRNVLGKSSMFDINIEYQMYKEASSDK